MQTEESVEEIIITGLWSSDDWAILALLATTLTLGFLKWRRGFGNCMGLLQKTVLAGVSGAICYVVFELGFDEQWPVPLFYGTSGALFAAGVLFPYVDRGKLALIKYIGLVAVSTASYWAAIEIASVSAGMGMAPDWSDFLVASLGGAFIVLFGARFIIPLRNSLTLAIAGLLAATIGGLAFGFSFDVGHMLMAIVYMAWHVLMATAIHIATGWSSSPERR
jgi:hypothetical protein